MDKYNNMSSGLMRGGGSGIESCSAPVRESQVNTELSELKDRLNLMAEFLIALEKRLDPILGTDTPSSDPKETNGRILVGLAEAIRGRRSEVEGANRMLNNILTRIEL